MNNKGKYTQRLIDMSNMEYLHKGLAKVNEIPEPVQITRKNRDGTIKGYVRSGYLVDYIGVSPLVGAIAFDAKETQSLTSFAFAGIHGKQQEYLMDFHRMGGKAFYIVNFYEVKEIYLIPALLVQMILDTGKKSIKLSYCQKNLQQVYPENGITLDYIRSIVESEF